MNGEIFTEYVRKYSAMVYRVAYSYTENAPDSEDIMQEVFLQLYRVGDKLSSEEHIKAWLIRVAVNKAKDSLKAARSKLTEPLDEALPASEPQIGSALAEAMSSLADKYRVVIYLHYYEGFGVRDISRALGITEANVKTRLKRGREKLKAFLTE